MENVIAAEMPRLLFFDLRAVRESNVLIVLHRHIVNITGLNIIIAALNIIDAILNFSWYQDPASND